MINIGEIKYVVKALLPDGKTVDITDILTDLSWGESQGEIAQKATLTMANTSTNMGYVSEFLKLCVNIFIYANEKEVMRGIVWDYDYESAMQKTVYMTVYDRMIYTQKSKDNNYFTAGKTTSGIISSICQKWGIQLAYWWENHTHSKTVYKNQAVSEQIFATLDEAAKKKGKTYVASMDQDVLYVFYKGSNPNVYIFNSDENVISTKGSVTLNNLVTKVVVVGKEDSAGRTPIKSVLTGKTEYGILQEIVSMSGNDKLSDAKAEAQQILEEKGTPSEEHSLNLPDVPFVRKGHKIKVSAGDLDGYFIVLGVNHQASTKTMSVEVERAV